jgi:hypothetical protein
MNATRPELAAIAIVVVTLVGCGAESGDKRFEEWAARFDPRLRYEPWFVKVSELAEVPAGSLDPLPPGPERVWVEVSGSGDVTVVPGGVLFSSVEPQQGLALTAVFDASRARREVLIVADARARWSRMVELVEYLRGIGIETILLGGQTDELPSPRGADLDRYGLPEGERAAAFGAWWNQLRARCPLFPAAHPDRYPEPPELAAGGTACAGWIPADELASFIAWMQPRHQYGVLRVHPANARTPLADELQAQRVVMVPKSWDEQRARLRLRATVAAATSDTLGGAPDASWGDVVRSMAGRTGNLRFALVAR